MDWQQRMTAAIECLEAGLYGEADLGKAARAANCSIFHFYRMFEVITGVGPGEYLRRRRLSEAALALSSGEGAKVIDLASGEFTYSIAVDAPPLEAPEGLSGMPEGAALFSVPASTWGKFTSRGPLRPNFQETIKRIFAEWMPASDWEHAGSAEIEYYPEAAGSPESPGYWCEYWVPLKKQGA